MYVPMKVIQVSVVVVCVR